MKSERNLQLTAWVLSSGVAVAAFVVWAGSLRWHFDTLSTYRLFPLFGLLAFSLMWSHYIVAGLRLYIGASKESLKTYFEVTSFAVLTFILLHPALLIWQLWRNGYGLPPESYKFYVGASLTWVVLLGTVSWLIFLAYELRRKFADRNWWRFVQYASDAAMFAVFYHSLRLGNNLRHGWFRYLWLFYGFSLVIVLVYQYLLYEKSE